MESILYERINPIIGGKYCSAKAIERIQTAIDDEAASDYSAMALDCPNEEIVECANEFRTMLSKKIRSKM